MNSLNTFLTKLIDYAGLFPPAELGMAAAVTNYARYQQGPFAWCLGRFIVPVSRLSEFEAEAALLLPVEEEKSPWFLSALIGPNPEADIERIKGFNQNHALPSAGRAVIDTVEVRATTVAEIERLKRVMPGELTVFVELPLSDSLPALISALGEVHLRAKIRTGGITPELFPTPAEIVRFISLCAQNQVPIKATAGLHHPIRSSHPLTYAAHSPKGMMHGFLNVFLAAAFVQAGLSEADAERLLLDESPASFQFSDTGVSWQGNHLNQEALNQLREQVAISFGSCSFEEPLQDLHTLNLLKSEE
ncbi:MAG: hypothetical protein HY774_20160 [Acidobacteria bacterium]|nr:hypothetical protein [Acidobacteriota bacterium]